MSRAFFRFHGDLERFLARKHRRAVIACTCARAATLKQSIESLGVPHTEIGRVLVNDRPATLARKLREGDAVEAFPHEPRAAPFEEPLAFIADAHLGGAARMLRMLGFDTLYDNALNDPEIVDMAAAERRVVLTRDRELHKRRDVLRGCYVHALKPEAQLREIDTRYDIAARMRPFSLCLHCNLPLATADQASVAAVAPERIRGFYRDFKRCPGCERVYWEGSHWERMRGVLAAALDVPPVTLGRREV
jgi:uncharacterized protein with PIN domain